MFNALNKNVQWFEQECLQVTKVVIFSIRAIILQYFNVSPMCD